MSDPNEQQINAEEELQEAQAQVTQAEVRLEDLEPESTEELATVKGGRHPYM